MQRTTKGAIASAAAAVLLLGGGTTLAYWTASADVAGGAVTAGELKLSAGTCDANWVYAVGPNAGQTVVAWVPGDEVTKDCDFTVTAVGDNLLATLSAPASVELTTASAAGADTESATVTATYTLNGAAIAGNQIDETANGGTLTVSFVVEFPYGTETTVNANDTQGWEADFEAITVTLTQVDPNP